MFPRIFFFFFPFRPKETGNKRESSVAGYTAVDRDFDNMKYFDAEAVTKRPFVISVQFLKVLAFV